jgi:hypothetical protein
MNIIKLNDIVVPEEYSFASFFNEELKGKYAYWIQMRYIFPLSSLNYRTYVQYEQLDPADFKNAEAKGILPHIDMYSEECCMLCFTEKYIDCETTEFANAIHDFKIANNYVTDPDIDISKLRNFRTWLATEILKFNTSTCSEGVYLNGLTDNQIHMLEYYKNNMYNEVTKQLSIFGVENAFSLVSNQTSCNCCQTNVGGLYNITGVPGCNALDIYVKNLHNLMVQTFENVDFWLHFNKDFIAVFKKYIDNIIKTGLIVTEPNDGVLYAICTCNKSNNVYETMLKNLSEALQYIIDDEVKGHLNFIHDALYNWAEHLYDRMYWNIK